MTCVNLAVYGRGKQFFKYIPFIWVQFAAQECNPVKGFRALVAKFFTKGRLVEAEISGSRQVVRIGFHSADDLHT